MRRMVLVLILIGVVVCMGTEAFSFDIYTIKKDRVDQEVSGNRGYIMGNTPAYTDQRNTKRTLIAVDIELPSGSKAAVEEDAVEPVKQEYSAPKETAVPKKVVVVEETIEEDEYIK